MKKKQIIGIVGVGSIHDLNRVAKEMSKAGVVVSKPQRFPVSDEQHQPTMDEIQKMAGASGDWFRRMYWKRARTNEHAQQIRSQGIRMKRFCWKHNDSILLKP